MHRRAREPGRGREAKSPLEIPARGWKDILLRTKKEFAEDQIPMIAAGVTFYTILALFPGLAALVSLYGLFADVGDVERNLQTLSYILPGGAISLIGDQLHRLATAKPTGLSAGFLLGLVTALWSANGAVKATMVGLNIAYEEKETRSLLRRTLISLAFTVGLTAFGLAATGILGAGPALEKIAGRPVAVAANVISWPVLIISLAVALALLYRFGPSRDPVRIQWISWGSAAVVIVWLILSAVFSLYVANFGHYNKTYGALGAAIGFMTWLYLSNIVVLGGAELNAEIEHQTTRDTTQGAPKPMGQRSAKMTDTVGEP